MIFIILICRDSNNKKSAIFVESTDNCSCNSIVDIARNHIIEEVHFYRRKANAIRSLTNFMKEVLENEKN